MSWHSFDILCVGGCLLRNIKRGIKSEPRKILFAKHTPSNIETVGQGTLSQLDLRQQV